jgi:hyperosmotically inducible protein
MKIPVTLLAVASASLLGLVACDKGNETSTTSTTSTTAPSPVDDTRLNARDMDASAVTPLDQGNDTADIQTTAAVRKALMADSTLSMNAKNIKVVTDKGVLTLRGPVASAGEKQVIDNLARSLAGANRVDDQLDFGTTK